MNKQQIKENLNEGLVGQMKVYDEINGCTDVGILQKMATDMLELYEQKRLALELKQRTMLQVAQQLQHEGEEKW